MYLYFLMYLLIVVGVWGALIGFKRTRAFWREAVFAASAALLLIYGGVYLNQFATVWATGDVRPLTGGLELPVAILLGSAKFVGVDLLDYLACACGKLSGVFRG